MEFHPVANIFPLITGEAFESLKEDIKANGLYEPVWIWQGKIIDGRNRWRACQEIGVTPATREWDGKGSLVHFILSLNLHRRHLEPSQRAMAAAEALSFLEEEAKHRMAEGGKKGGETSKRGKAKTGNKGKEKIPDPYSPPVNTNGTQARDEAATLFHTNPRYVQDAKRIKAESPELAEKVAQGTLTIPQAKKQLPKQERSPRGGGGKKWDVADDIDKISEYIDKFRHRWSEPTDKARLQHFFRQLANEV